MILKIIALIKLFTLSILIGVVIFLMINQMKKKKGKEERVIKNYSFEDL